MCPQIRGAAPQALATLLSQIRTYCEVAIDLVTLGTEHSRIAETLQEFKSDPDGTAANADRTEAKMLEVLYQAQTNSREALFEALREHRANIHSSYALAKLHFKPDDVEFPHFQAKIDQALALLEGWKRSRDRNAEALRANVTGLVTEAEAIGRTLLKKEWETIKGGEASYRTTKAWAKVGGIIGAVLLAILLVWSVTTTLLSQKDLAPRTGIAQSATSEPKDRKEPDLPSQRTDASCQPMPTQLTVIQHNGVNGENTEYVREATPRPRKSYKALECLPSSKQP